MTKLILAATVMATLIGHPLLAQDDHEQHESGAHSETEEHHDEGIEWTESLQKEFGIETAIVGSGHVQIIRELPGEIDFHLDHLAHVTSRYSGVVKAIYAHVGEAVKKGAVLAVVESNDSLTNYQIKAPISGVIFEKHLTIGESVPDSTEIFKIADTSHLWVDFHAYSDISSRIKVGTLITIQNQMGNQLNSKISYVAPALSKETRTLKARAAIRSTTSDWASGMFVTVRVPLESLNGDVVIPKTALQRLGDEWIVFVKDAHDMKPQHVELGSEDENRVIVLKGLQKGQEIVSKGSFVLKAELEKESFGDGHGH